MVLRIPKIFAKLRYELDKSCHTPLGLADFALALVFSVKHRSARAPIYSSEAQKTCAPFRSLPASACIVGDSSLLISAGPR